MAIVIPSKYIYNVDNPKVRDNYVDKVEVGQTTVTPNNEYEKVVYSETFKNNLCLYFCKPIVGQYFC